MTDLPASEYERLRAAYEQRRLDLQRAYDVEAMSLTVDFQRVVAFVARVRQELGAQNQNIEDWLRVADVFAREEAKREGLSDYHSQKFFQRFEQVAREGLAAYQKARKQVG